MNQKTVEIGFLASVIFVFGAQTYMLYGRYIPETLDLYAASPAIRAHVEGVIGVFSNLLVTWFFLAVIGPVVRLASVHLSKQKAKGTGGP
jgi:hypothetical protein